MNKKHIKISKFLSYVLRHQPHSIGLTLDREGWVDIDALIVGANRKGYAIDINLLHDIVVNDDKKRFTISTDGKKIRAAQGHSNKTVTVQYQPTTPPEILYHGTASRFLDAILRDGLTPRTRQYVHLSTDKKTARRVGQRHGQPVILKIAAQNMHQQGFSFFQADNGVWLTDRVPSDFFTIDMQ